MRCLTSRHISATEPARRNHVTARNRGLGAASMAAILMMVIICAAARPNGATAQTTTAAPPTNENEDVEREPAQPAKKSGESNAGRASAPAAKPQQNPDQAAGGLTRRQTLMASLTIFVLAVFVGFEVITKVPPTLHTPLMSGSNAISGITIVGAIVVTGISAGLSSWLGWLAVVFAAINVVGGFLVTHRMLSMFRRK